MAQGMRPRRYIASLAVRGDDLYLLANTSAVRGKVLKTSARAPGLTRAATVMPMGALVIEALSGACDGIYVTTMDGGIQRLKRIAPDGSVADVRLPYDGSIVYANSDTASDGILVSLTGWVQPSGIWAVDARTLTATDTGITPKPPIDLTPYIATRLFATAKDGVKIPVSIVGRRDTPRDRKRPAIVESYGAYQYGTSPAFRARNLAFLDAGGICVVAGVRGGRRIRSGMARRRQGTYQAEHVAGPDRSVRGIDRRRVDAPGEPCDGNYILDKAVV